MEDELKIHRVANYWEVRRGRDRMSVHPTQQRAIRAAKRRAAADRGRLVWHDRAGRVQGSVSFERDALRRRLPRVAGTRSD
jgi:hypothetical protein